MHNGWYQVAYARDLTNSIHEVTIRDQKIALIKLENGSIRAISAYCPHRGANLCKGGVLKGETIICPFHELPVRLDGQGRMSARDFDVLLVSGLVFIRKKNQENHAFASRMSALDKDHYIVPGFEEVIEADARMVIENAFDQTHFRPVHKVRNMPQFSQAESPEGSYAVQGAFELPASKWQTGIKQGETAMTPFLATAYSPTIVLSRLSGDRPYCMLTTTQPLDKRRCIVRLSLAIPAAHNGQPPTQDECHYLLTQARAGIAQDAGIWAFMSPEEIFNPLPDDEFVVGFRQYCSQFS